jgi:hypothetical protein
MIDIIAAILLTTLYALGVSALVASAPLVTSTRLKLALIAVLWLLGIASLAAVGVFAAPGSGTLAIGIAILTPIAGALIAAIRSSAFRRAVTDIPTAVLVVIHAGRLLGVFFLVLLSAGRLPHTFATVAGWGDIAVAAAALPLAWAIARRVRGWRALTASWNLIGFADLVTAVALGIGSAPGSPVRFIFESPESGTIASLPWLLIPGVLVPMYLLTHLAVFGQLLGDAQRRRAGSHADLAWGNAPR